MLLPLHGILVVEPPGVSFADAAQAGNEVLGEMPSVLPPTGTSSDALCPGMALQLKLERRMDYYSSGGKRDWV